MQVPVFQLPPCKLDWAHSCSHHRSTSVIPQFQKPKLRGCMGHFEISKVCLAWFHKYVVVLHGNLSSCAFAHIGLQYVSGRGGGFSSLCMYSLNFCSVWWCYSEGTPSAAVGFLSVTRVIVNPADTGEIQLCTASARVFVHWLFDGLFHSECQETELPSSGGTSHCLYLHFTENMLKQVRFWQVCKY